jgi:hypothetical protein
MRYLLLAIALLLPVSVHAEWVIPEHPDPDKIYDEAKEDKKSQRYDLALEKHIWFHQNALKYRRSLYGVRLSFALSHWLDLSEVYPPALLKLKEVRDQANYNVKNGMNASAFFHDFESINEKLGDSEQTVDLFKWLDSNQPEVAKNIYRLAQPVLVDAEEYKLCGKYLDSSVQYKRMVKYFRWGKTIEKEENNPQLNGFADRKFIYDSSVLVALLVLNDQYQEAENIAEKARQESESENEDFGASLQLALQGQLPEPWC